MLYLFVAAIWLLAGLFAGAGLVVVRWQAREGREAPFLNAKDALAAALLLVVLLAAGGLFGFALAMLLDYWLGGWGILLAGTLCGGLCLAIWRWPRPGVQKEDA